MATSVSLSPAMDRWLMLAEPTITYCRDQHESSDRLVQWAHHKVDALTPLQINMGPGLKAYKQPAVSCHSSYGSTATCCLHAHR